MLCGQAPGNDSIYKRKWAVVVGDPTGRGINFVAARSLFICQPQTEMPAGYSLSPISHMATLHKSKPDSAGSTPAFGPAILKRCVRGSIQRDAQVFDRTQGGAAADGR